MNKIDSRKIIFYIVSSFLVVIAIFTVIELTTRLVSAVSGRGFTLALHELDPYDKSASSIYTWHPFTGFIFKRNNKFRGSHPYSKKSSMIRIDENGFPVEEGHIPLEKETNELRIAIVGASTSASISLEVSENWPGLLGKMVQKKYPGKKITIINGAVPGFNTAQSIGNLALRIMPYQPDVVIIYHAYNDLKAIRPDRKFKVDYTHIHTKPFGQFDKPSVLVLMLNHSMAYVRTRNRYRALNIANKAAEASKNKKASGRISNIPRQAATTFKRNIRTLVYIARAGNAKVILSSFATLNDLAVDYTKQKNIKKLSRLQVSELNGLVHFTTGLDLKGIQQGINKYNATLKQVAKIDKTGWIDNAAMVPHEDKYFLDRVHFNKEGAKKMAKNFFPEVVKALRKK